MQSEYETWFSSGLEKLQERIGYIFIRDFLLRSALVHSSFAHENGLKEHNERMEFLGDAVLQLGVSHFLFETRTEEDEGILSRCRASLVCGAALFRWARHVGIPPLLRMGKGLAHGSPHLSLFADAAEAVFGAAFLDGGMDAADTVLRGYLDFQASQGVLGDFADPKSRLQSEAQQRGLGLPVYEILSLTGPSHAPVFEVLVKLGDAAAGHGTGNSRKRAEADAARKGLDSLMSETVTL